MAPVRKALDALWNAFETSTATDFAAYIHTAAKSQELQETLQLVPRKEFERLASALKSRVDLAFADESLWDVADGDPAQDTDGCLILRAAVKVLAVLVEDDKVPHQLLLEPALALHDTLLSLRELGSFTSRLQTDIVRMCEAWWKHQRPERDSLALQTVPYLLIAALAPDAKVLDVRRAYEMREALSALDWQDESIASLRALLPRCMVAPLYLRVPEGRQLLAFFFTLSIPLIDELFKAIKAQLPLARQSVQEAYGDVLWHAWRLLSGQPLLVFEQRVIQELMHAGCFAARESTVRAALRVIHVFCAQRKARGVGDMLVRLYEPFLWRALHAANPVVRRNAISALANAFPLQLENATRQDADALLHKQITLLGELMDDPVPDVRRVAGAGACLALSTYWPLFPATVAQALTQRAVSLALDATSGAVRAAALEGLQMLLREYLAHPVLKSLLPDLRVLLMDSSRVVREQMSHLLAAVSRVRAIKFTEIVPMPTLLDRLSCDPSPVVRENLAACIAPTYLPDQKPLAEQRQRALTLCTENPQAARLFFRTAATQLTPAAAGRLAVALFTTAPDLPSAACTASALEATAALLSSGSGAETVLAEPKLAALLSDESIAERLLVPGADAGVTAALVRVAAAFPKKTLVRSEKAVTSLLTAGGSAAAVRAACAEALCGWGKADTLVKIVAGVLTPAALACVQPAASATGHETGKRKRRGATAETAAAAAVAAGTGDSDGTDATPLVQVLLFVLTRADLCKAALNHATRIDALLLRLPSVVEAVVLVLGKSSRVESAQPALAALTALWSLALRARRQAVIAAAAESVLSQLLPALSEAWARRGGSPAALHVAQTLVALTADSVACGALGPAEGAALTQELIIAAEAASVAGELVPHAAKAALYTARPGLEASVAPAAAVLSSAAANTQAGTASAAALASALSALAAADSARACLLSQAAMPALVRAEQRTAPAPLVPDEDESDEDAHGPEPPPAAAEKENTAPTAPAKASAARWGPLGAALVALARTGNGAAATLSAALQPLQGLAEADGGVVARRLATVLQPAAV